MKKSQNAGYLTIAQAVGYLQVSPSTLYRLINRGHIDSIKIGGSTRISLDSLDEYARGSSDNV